MTIAETDTVRSSAPESATPGPRLRLQHGIPPHLLAQFRPLLGVARNLGIGVSGTRGVGKSQLLKTIAWLDFVAHAVPLVVFDPIGAVIDGLLAQICYFHPDDQRALWQRIRYVNLSPERHVVPLPIYAPTGLGKESLYDLSQRLPDAIRRLDAKLSDAAVLGMNSIWELSTAAGQILIALGYGVSEIESLLRDPEPWLPLLAEAEARHPEIAEAVRFIRTDYLGFSAAERKRRSTTLLTKLKLLSDPVTKAQFCAATPGIDWRAVMDQKLCVLIDARNEFVYETRQLKMLLLWTQLVDFIWRWGAQLAGDRSFPLSIVIDELSFLLAPGSSQKSLLASDLDGLINRLSRNFNTWITASFQEPYQLPTGMRQTLLSLGTQFYGRMTDGESMRQVAERLTVYDPFLIKKRTPVYGGYRGEHWVIDERTQEYSLSEQRALTAHQLGRLPKYTFLVSRTANEGEAAKPTATFSIAPFAARRFPPKELVTGIRTRLSARDGQPVADILAEIAARGPRSAAPALPRRRASQPALIVATSATEIALDLPAQPSNLVLQPAVTSTPMIASPTAVHPAPASLLPRRVRLDEAVS